MKKNVAAKLLSLLLVLLLVLSVTACGSGGKNGVAGTYELKTIKVSGITVDVEDAADMLGGEVTMELNLKDNGKYSLKLDFAGDNESGEGEWTQDGNTITMDVEGETITGTIDGKTLELDFSVAMDGMLMILEKK